MKYTVVPAEQKECSDEVHKFLHDCWVQMEAGRPLQPNPFYERNALLTPAIVMAVIGELVNLQMDEFKKFPGYHNNAQGIDIANGEILIPTPFDKLPYPEQLAIVQGIDRIMQPYRAVDPVPGSETSTPIPETYEYYC